MGLYILSLLGGEKDIVKEKAHFEVYKPASSQQNSRKMFYIDLNSSLLEKLYDEQTVDESTIAAFAHPQAVLQLAQPPR